MKRCATELSAELSRGLALAGSLGLALALTMAGGCSVAAGAAEPAHPGHAHNDYRHARPLLDALAHGFHNVEVDIFLVDGELQVAHDLDEVGIGTLQQLYLAPLADRVQQNGGAVHPGGEPFTLLVDIKADGAAVYPVLRRALAEHRAMLSVYRDDGVDRGAVSVILSGDRPRDLVEREPERLCAIDGRTEDLASEVSPFLVPWISEPWSALFDGDTAELDDLEKALLARFVLRAHEQGRLVRLWGTPDSPAAWAVQRECGVDLINTDELAGFEDWARRDP